MPSYSRRSLLSLLGCGTAAVLAGCNTDSSTETLSETADPSTETPATTVGGAKTATEPGGTPDATACTTVSRPELAWPVPRGSPARDGYVVEPSGPQTAPTPAWEAEPAVPDDSSASPAYGLPVIAGDSLHVTKQLNRGPQRRVDGHVQALDTETGDRRWSSDRLQSPSHPVLWGDLAVVVAQNENADTVVVAFDRASGTRRWTREFTAQFSGFVPAGDHLYLAVENDSHRLEGTLTALAEDGSEVWRHERALADHVTEAPTAGTDDVYFASRDGRLHARARDDGRANWTHRFEHPTAQQPYITDIVATTCSVITVVEGAVKALDDDGTLVWEAGGDHGILATDGETLYTVDIQSRGDREVRALDATTGEVRWRKELPDTIGWPALLGTDTIYVRSDESVVALDRADGTVRWRTDSWLDELALVDDTLYGTRRGTLLALR